MADKLFLIGGGELLFEAVCALQDNKLMPVEVIADERHMEETFGGKTLRNHLKARKAVVHELEQLNPKTLGPIVKAGTKAAAISLGASWIIKKDVRAFFSKGVFNVHCTRLPQNRGGGGSSWQILRGNKYGCALLHHVDDGIDTGGIVLVKEFLYTHCRTPAEYDALKWKYTLELVIECVTHIASGKAFTSIGQPEYLSMYWPRLNAEIHGWIDWRWSGEDIVAFINAFDDPYCGAHTFLNGRKVYIKKVHLDINDGRFHPFQSGIVYRTSAEYIAAASVSGTVLIGEVFDEQGRKISLKDIQLGERLFTPSDQLEAALSERVFYNAKGLKRK